MADQTQYAQHAAISSKEALREQYGEPLPMAVAVTKTHLDKHHQHFIRHSPFVCIASTTSDGYPNVSPKGDRPGFVHIRDDKTLIIPDRPGNNKVETFENVMDNPKVALVFFIPGVKESVRVHGTAELVHDAAILELGKVGQKLPPAALVVHVTKAYLHCGKALIRSKLWEPDSQVAAGVIPPFSQVIKEQANVPMPVEKIQEAIDHTYQDELY